MGQGLCSRRLCSALPAALPSSPSQAFEGLGSSCASFQMVDLWNSAIKFPPCKATTSCNHLKEKSHDFPHLQPANKWFGEKTCRYYRPDCFHVTRSLVYALATGTFFVSVLL